MSSRKATGGGEYCGIVIYIAMTPSDLRQRCGCVDHSHLANYTLWVLTEAHPPALYIQAQLTDLSVVERKVFLVLIN